MTRSIFAGALLLVGAFAACGSDGEPAARQTSPSPSPTQTATTSALDGTITVSYTVDDMRKAGISEHERCENAGTHTITLALGRWTFEQTAAQGCSTTIAGTGEGSFSGAGDVVTFTEPAAFGCSSEYSYRFAISDKTVTFRLDTDDCEPRRVIFTTKPWTLTS